MSEIKEVIKNMAQLLQFLAPPVQFLDFIEKEQAKGMTISPEAQKFCTNWRRINSGEPVPEIDNFETTPSPQENSMSPETARKYIVDAEAIAQRTLDASVQLEEAIKMTKTTAAVLKESEESLKDGEAEVIMDDSDSDLIGENGKPIAKSSDAYKLAVRKLLGKAYEGSLLEQVKERDKWRRQAREADISHTQAEVQFRALLHVSDLTGNILRALSS